MSGRIRTLKPEWLEDELLASQDDSVRLLSVALILIADDLGRGRAAPPFIVSQAWMYLASPESLTKAREGLQRLASIGFIRLYTVENQAYYEIRNWTRHQKVQHPGAPRVPPPSAIRESLTKVPESLTPDLRSPIIEKDQREGRESEGNHSGMLGSSREPDPLSADKPPRSPKKTSSGSPKPLPKLTGDERGIADAWLLGRSRLGGLGKPVPVIDSKRHRAISNARRLYEQSVCVAAAKGIWCVEWNRTNGETDIALALRDAAHIEKFAAAYDAYRNRIAPDELPDRAPQATETAEAASARAELEGSLETIGALA